MAIRVSFPFSRVAQPEARWLSLPHLVTNWSGLQKLIEFPVHAHSISLMHFRRLWNGMFDRHRAKITVMQFTGHSLPVHQFVTVPWDFNPVPYCQPSSPTPTEYALPPSLEWHVWSGRRSIYYIKLGNFYQKMIIQHMFFQTLITKDTNDIIMSDGFPEIDFRLIGIAILKKTLSILMKR